VFCIEHVLLEGASAPCGAGDCSPMRRGMRGDDATFIYIYIHIHTYIYIYIYIYVYIYMYTWQVRIEGVFRRHVARSDYRFEMERTERMRNMPYMQVVN